MKQILFILTFFFLFICATQCQTEKIFTHDDTLRGTVTPQRAWWDLTFYDLKVKIDVKNKSISGSNTIYYTVLDKNKNAELQIDLQEPLVLEKVEQNGRTLEFTKAGKNAYFVKTGAFKKIGEHQSVTVFYSGVPKAAVNPPWDGGFSWNIDAQQKPFIATSCQNLGASVWWPCKDHQYDEPDSMHISVTVPDSLMDISNGRLFSEIQNADRTKTFEWHVNNPINNYGVDVNIADYAHLTDSFVGEKGNLTLNYYVLKENTEKAKSQFVQVKQMLKAFENWFGPYPFYQDGYKLVEVPYLGMEHQSSVTYGNKYANGYLGRDLSGTGWGLKWDFIIVHESGHEWFGNNITTRDIADMWVHEGFTAYSESLFTEFYYGKKAGAEYVIGTRKLIANDKPIIGHYDVNNEGSDDMYYKGSNMLHTIRQIVNNDSLWHNILRGLNKDFYHQTVTTAQIENYISEKSRKKLGRVFEQYLRTTKIPILEYKFEKKHFSYRWTNCVAGFDMPIKIFFDKNVSSTWLYPTPEWQRLKNTGKELKLDNNFYVGN